MRKEIQENILSGYRATGIYPFYPSVIPELVFVPSLVTESPKKRLEINDGNPGNAVNNNDEWSSDDDLSLVRIKTRKPHFTKSYPHQK